jgi:hypothetical protein
MEWLNKFTNPLTERAKSPLYGAFLFSWLIWNWRIVLTVLMPSQVKFEGLSLTAYISTHFLNIYDGLIIPLIYSMFYIFILPWLDLELIKFTEEEKRKKIDEKIKIGRKHSVDGNLFFDLKLKFEEERQRINKADTKNKELSGEILKGENKIAELTGSNNNLDAKLNLSLQDLQQTKKISNELLDRINLFEKRKNLQSRFEGRWTFEYFDKENTIIQGKEEIEIINNQFFIIKGPENRVLAFEIMVPDYDVEQKYFTFVKYNLKTPGNNSVNFLNIIGKNRFEGFENKTIAVTYTKSEIQ